MPTGLISFHRVCLFVSFFISFFVCFFVCFFVSLFLSFFLFQGSNTPIGMWIISDTCSGSTGRRQHLLANVAYIVYLICKSLHFHDRKFLRNCRNLRKFNACKYVLFYYSVVNFTENGPLTARLKGSCSRTTKVLFWRQICSSGKCLKVIQKYCNSMHAVMMRSMIIHQQ